MEISRVYYTENTFVETFEIKVAMWPNGIDDAHATWGAGQNTGHTVGGRNAIGYLIDIKFLPPNQFIQGLLFRRLKVIRSFEADLGDGSNTIARFWFNSSPDYNGVRRIHRDVIIKFTKLLKSKGYLVHFDSAFLTDDDFFRETATTPSDIKELEEIKKQKEREEVERQAQLEADAAERLAEIRKIAEAESKRLAKLEAEAEEKRSADKPTMPKGWSPEEDKPKKISKPKKESSDPIGTSRLNREQLREAGRKRIKEKEKIIKSTYEKKRRRRQSSGGGKKAIIIGIPVLVVFVVLFSGMDQGDVIEIPSTGDKKNPVCDGTYQDNRFKIILTGGTHYETPSGTKYNCNFSESNIGLAKIRGQNNYQNSVVVLIQDSNSEDAICIKKINRGFFDEFISIHNYLEPGQWKNLVFFHGAAPNSDTYFPTKSGMKCWVKDNGYIGEISVILKR